MNNCETCKWWKEIEKSGPISLNLKGKAPRVGLCHFNPPTPAFGANGQLSPVLPPAGHDNFCSKHETIPESS